LEYLLNVTNWVIFLEKFQINKYTVELLVYAIEGPEKIRINQKFLHDSHKWEVSFKAF
jgi:hypothetical protein